jgi:hypothetical protein
VTTGVGRADVGLRWIRIGDALVGLMSGTVVGLTGAGVVVVEEEEVTGAGVVVVEEEEEPSKYSCHRASSESV